jgi:glycosyltransferase involved in cell wall biosynthesis
MRRIAAIDSIFHDLPRWYLEVSFKRNLRRTVRSAGLITIECINYSLHQHHLVRRLESAKCIYVHSALNAIKLFPRQGRYTDKTISDLHGVMPEEETFKGRWIAGKLLGFIEREMVKDSFLVVVVTDRMGRHFLDKYPGAVDPGRLLTLPNFEFRDTELTGGRQGPRAGNGLRLIYAGGVEKWQNIDLMLATIHRLTLGRPDVKVDVYVPEHAVEKIRVRAHALHLSGQVRIGHLPPDQLLREYQKSDAGFVLRDDILLNRVAMPTKLVEYMRWGVVPIVLSPDVGDFRRYGYEYLTLDELFGAGPSHQMLSQMRATNLKVIASLTTEVERAKRILRSAVLQRTGLPQAEEADHLA